MATPTYHFERRVSGFLPLTDMIRDLLQFILATRPLAFLVRFSDSLGQQVPSYKADIKAGFILAIGAAKEAGDKFAEAEHRGWFTPLLSRAPKDQSPLHEIYERLCIYCARDSSDSLLSRIKPIRDNISFHVDRAHLARAHQQLATTVQEFHLINPAEGIADPFLESLASQIVEITAGKSSSDLQFLVEEVPDFCAALVNFGEQIYNLLLLEQLARERNEALPGPLGAASTAVL